MRSKSGCSWCAKPVCKVAGKRITRAGSNAPSPFSRCRDRKGAGLTPCASRTWSEINFLSSVSLWQAGRVRRALCAAFAPHPFTHALYARILRRYRSHPARTHPATLPTRHDHRAPCYPHHTLVLGTLCNCRRSTLDGRRRNRRCPTTPAVAAAISFATA